MKSLKKLLSFFLCLAMLLPLLPANVFAAEPEVRSMDDGYIKVDVSTANGGFLIGTAEGNRLKKSDNNKNLLYHNGKYDTSFISFRVGEGTDARDYIFGGSYPDKSSTGVTVSQDDDSITASWSVEGITFTETFSLAPQESNEHGLVSINLGVSGTAEPVQARVLLDTCLGDQDYAYYQVNGGTLVNTLQTEQDLYDDAQHSISNFFAVNDISAPSIEGRMVSTPSRVSIGHWNNLAATLFDFTPNTTLNFTNIVNEYLTADSACALYYSMSASNPVTLYYGVYSNWDVLDTERVAINLSAPLRLNLNDTKTAFIRQNGMPGEADFSVHVSAENYLSDTSRDYENVLLVVSSTSGLRPLGDSGELRNDLDFDSIDPMTIPYAPLKQGEGIEKTLYFKAKLGDGAAYERITISVYNNTENGDLVKENLLGERVLYILLPGSDGSVPKVHFNSMTPKTVYHEGTRHLYVAVANAELMENALASGNCEVWVTTQDGKKAFAVSSSGITFSEGVADIVLDDTVKLPVGACRVELRWTDAAVSQNIVTAQFKIQTAEVLKFTVSDDPKYRNDCYGIIAAVKYGTFASTDDPITYRLLPFKDEADFQKFSKKEEPYKNEKYKEILLVYRGAFVGDRRYTTTDDQGHITGYTYYTAVSKETIKDGKSRVDNTITINNCLDFEAGTMSVYYEDYAKGEVPAKQSAILCEFDGKLYTSVARTSVWEGKAALTKLEQGSDFSLITYDKDGNRTNKNSSADPITLIWPNVYGYGQKLAGMIFKLAYGQFGVMKDGDKELGRVIGFAASLNLKFMKSPAQEDDTAAPDTYFGRMKELWTDWRGASIYQYAYHGARYEKLTNISMNDSKEDHDKAQQGVAASVMVPDILFGCGEGFVGLHFTVDLTIQNMIDSLPKISGKLEVNTIGDWSFGLEGSCKLEKFTMEAKLSFKSRDNIPIPDEIYFYMGGFEPGLNIDGCGTVWLKGLGGGISNIYDTIFMTSGLPPLKLTVKAAFSIIQVLDGKAKLELSLSGIKLSATDLKIKDTIEVIRSITLGLQWYPDLNLQASIYVDMFEKTIAGNGYIVLVGKNYKDWDFEMFARVRLMIPESIPAVGGMTLLGINVGIGTKKIWGAFEALSLSLGVTYFWGESGVHVGAGGDFAQPSYPSLLELNGYDEDSTDIPIGYDAESDRVLYARIGTNLEPPVGAQIVGENELQLLGLAGIWSNAARTIHKINLGEYDDYNCATLVQANFPAASLAEAKTLASAFTVKDAGENPLTLTMPQPVPAQGANQSDEDYEAEIAPIVAANAAANANVTWAETMVWDDSKGEYVGTGTGVGTFAFSLTDSSEFDKDWFFSTAGTAADVVFYNVLSMPKLTNIGISEESYGGVSYFEVSWNGVNPDELDTIAFYLTKGNSDPLEEGIALGISDYTGWGGDSFGIPADLPSGDYYLRAVYSKEDEVNGVIWSDAAFHYDNPNMPAAMGAVTVQPCGDLKFSVSIPATDDANTTGYLVEILDAEGKLTDLGELRFDKAVDGSGDPVDTVFKVGGSYSMDVPDDPADPDSPTHKETVGLTAGQSYTVRVRPCCDVDPDPSYGPGLNGGTVCGDSYTSAPMLMPAPVTPSVTMMVGDKPVKSVKNLAANESAPVFSAGSLTFDATFSETVSGSWTLDGSGYWNDTLPTDAAAAPTGSFNGTSAQIVLTDLSEGGHILTLKGNAPDGDGFAAEYSFTVDTLPPRLMLTSPLNGSPFNAGGTVTIAGVTDKGEKLCISVDGGAVQTVVPTVDADGVFSFDLSIPDYNGAAYHKLAIYAEDACGNRTDTHAVEVSHPGLGTMTGVAIMAGGVIYPSGGVSSAQGFQELQLSLAGVTPGGSAFVLDPDLVHWSAHAAEGTVTVDTEGRLSCSPNARGYVEAQYEVSTGAFLTAVLALGLNGGEVSLSYTPGGTATGGGIYDPDETVTLTATPDAGYVFDGWRLYGVSVADPTKLTVSFQMPAAGVEAQARFKAEKVPQPDPNPNPNPDPGGLVVSGGGDTEEKQIAHKNVPEGVDPNRYVPFYTDDNGETVVIPVSNVDQGVITYLVPKGRTVEFKEVPVSFTDIDGHWAKNDIVWTAAHGLFNGVGNDRFDPYGTMTRAMFVTVLYRLAGSPEVIGAGPFTDVRPATWYTDAVTWAAEMGIVKGRSDAIFDPDSNVTREQMCAFVARFLRTLGYTPTLGDKVEFTDAAAISGWAAEDVEFCQRIGIINGRPDGSFDPRASATRAENAAVLKRVVIAILDSLEKT